MSLYSRPGPLVPGGRGIQVSLGVPEEKEEKTPATVEAERPRPSTTAGFSLCKWPVVTRTRCHPAQSVPLSPRVWVDVEMCSEDTPGAGSGRDGDTGTQAWAPALADAPCPGWRTVLGEVNLAAAQHSTQHLGDS